MTSAAISAISASISIISPHTHNTHTRTHTHPHVLTLTLTHTHTARGLTTPIASSFLPFLHVFASSLPASPCLYLALLFLPLRPPRLVTPRRNAPDAAATLLPEPYACWPAALERCAASPEQEEWGVAIKKINWSTPRPFKHAAGGQPRIPMPV